MHGKREVGHTAGGCAKRKKSQSGCVLNVDTVINMRGSYRGAMNTRYAGWGRAVRGGWWVRCSGRIGHVKKGQGRAQGKR